MGLFDCLCALELDSWGYTEGLETRSCTYKCSCFCDGKDKAKSFTRTESSSAGQFGIPSQPSSCRLIERSNHPSPGMIATFDTDIERWNIFSPWWKFAREFHGEMKALCEDCGESK